VVEWFWTFQRILGAFIFKGVVWTAVHSLPEADFAEKLIDADLVKKFPIFYGTQTFVAMSATPRVPVLSQQFCPVFFRCVWVLSTLHVGLRSGLCPSGFPTKTPHAFLFSSLCVLCPAHFTGLDIVTGKTFGEAYNS
jgi:hypothetical protein